MTGFNGHIGLFWQLLDNKQKYFKEKVSYPYGGVIRKGKKKSVLIATNFFFWDELLLYLLLKIVKPT